MRLPMARFNWVDDDEPGLVVSVAAHPIYWAAAVALLVWLVLR